MISHARILRGLVVLSLTALPAAAQVTSVGPFAGDETTEFADLSLTPIKGRMTPAGYVSTPHITGIVGRESAGAGSSALTPSFGGRMLRTIDHGCVMPSIFKWRLDEVADRVGFEVATTESSTTNITVALIDVNGATIGSVAETIPAGGNGWSWLGYESTIPIRRVHIRIHASPTPVPIYVDRLVRGTEMGPSIGLAYGLATTNSTGAAAQLHAHGSTLLSDGDLTLRATDVPSASLGVFLYASETGRMPLGDGLLLLGSTRFTRLPSQMSAASTMTLAVDVSSQPFASGETWYFQAWFRDQTPGGAGSNLTHGLAIQFL